MQKLKLYKLWLAAGVVQIFIIIYLSLTPGVPSMPGVHVDKLYHFLAYLVVTLWFVQLWQPRFHWVLLISFILLGVIMEIIQGGLSYRSFDFVDMLANACGVCSAVGLGRTRVAHLLASMECYVFVGTDGINR